MALLSEEKRKKYFKTLDLGEYNESNIRKLQKKYLRKQDVDGIYGTDTDNLLRHIYNCSLVKDFKPEEFKCECGGRYCTGYPTYMRKVELQHLQRIRDHYKKPMTVTCGMRCRPYNNSLVGSIPNSLHLYGLACDFNMDGVTESTAQRKKAINWIKTLPNHHYTYGNGYNSYGAPINAPYMGSGNGAAIHTDTSQPKTATVKKQTTQEKIVAFAKKIAADNSWHYVHWKKDDPKTKECPICHKHPKGKYHGTYCTIFPVMCWHHGGGIKMKCGNCLNNGLVDRIYNAKTKAEALKLARKYLGVKDIEVIRSKSGIARSALKAGDMCYYYKGNSCQHAFLYIGNGKMIDANSYKDEKKQIAVRKAMSCKVAIRYVGK